MERSSKRRRKKLKVYLAGKMRGLDCFGFPAFTSATEVMRYAGHEVISPAEMDQEKYGWGECPDTNVNEEFSIEDALRRDFDAIIEVDAVVLLPGWETSTGAKFERNVADALLKPVYLYNHLKRDGIGALVPPFASVHPPMITGELRIVDADTGGAKGQKLARFDLVPQAPLWTVAELYGKGAEKYAERNWELGYDWNLSIAALGRHWSLFQQGEDIDPEIGLPHLAAVVFHAFALMEFSRTHPEKDNRAAR